MKKTNIFEIQFRRKQRLLYVLSFCLLFLVTIHYVIPGIIAYNNISRVKSSMMAFAKASTKEEKEVAVRQILQSMYEPKKLESKNSDASLYFDAEQSECTQLQQAITMFERDIVNNWDEFKMSVVNVYKYESYRQDKIGEAILLPLGDISDIVNTDTQAMIGFIDSTQQLYLNVKDIDDDDNVNTDATIILDKQFFSDLVAQMRTMYAEGCVSAAAPVKQNMYDPYNIVDDPLRQNCVQGPWGFDQRCTFIPYETTDSINVVEGVER